VLLADICCSVIAALHNDAHTVIRCDGSLGICLKVGFRSTTFHPPKFVRCVIDLGAIELFCPTDELIFYSDESISYNDRLICDIDPSIDFVIIND
jgi:hypothetical protein